MTMTNAEINRTIAEALGMTVKYVGDPNEGEDEYLIVEHNIHDHLDPVLDYTTDANACFEACERLGLWPAIMPYKNEDGANVFAVKVSRPSNDKSEKGMFAWRSVDKFIFGPQITPLLARAIAEAVKGKYG